MENVGNDTFFFLVSEGFLMEMVNKFTFLGDIYFRICRQWDGKEVHLNKCLKWYGNIYFFRAPFISEFIKHLEGKKQGTLE